MGTYTIQSGDTLAKIAEKYGTTVDKIATDNNISDVNMILAGDELNIFAELDSNTSNSSNVYMEEDLSNFIDDSTYTVQNGDTLSKIAEQTGVSLDDLIKNNNIVDPNKIYTGDVLVLKPKIDEMVKKEELTVASNEVLDESVNSDTEVLDITSGVNEESRNRMALPDLETLDLSIGPVETLSDVDDRIDSVIETLNESTNEDLVVNTTTSLSGSYEGLVRYKNSASQSVINDLGVLTYNNKIYNIGDFTSGNSLSMSDYYYLVGQVAGESGMDNDDMLAVASTILNRLEAGGGSVKSVLQTGYWPWGKTCDKFINYDYNGNPLGVKDSSQLSTGDYQKLQDVIRVIQDAMNGVRNINKDTIYYAGDGVHNYFSDSYM